ncbi:hypothetical protein ACLOJK_038097 [Asimina triloba]
MDFIQAIHCILDSSKADNSNTSEDSSEEGKIHKEREKKKTKTKKTTKMAESAVSFLLEYLGRLLDQEVKLLKGVRGEARRIRDELESMRCFLRDADAREDSSEIIKNWVRQVRAAAYETEDILDEFIIQIGQYHDASGVYGILRKAAYSIKQLKARRRIGKQIQDIRLQLSDISRRKNDYNFSRTEQGSSSLSNSNEEAYDPRLAALFAEESQLVGIDEPRSQLIEWLVNGVKKLSTISVVGMGGLGKTTLVKKAYDSERVKKHFETRAWITVSQTFNKNNLLQDMIRQFYTANHEQAPSRIDMMTDIQLIEQLHDYLQSKRFVIVIDDVWGVDAWKFLGISLPARENGSRVILTTRRADIASACCAEPSDHRYDLQPLDQMKAWSLFCRRAFPSNEGNHCPPELEELARSFVNKCRGLPLAIVMLGSLLATKDQKYVTWELMHRGLGSELENDDHLKHMAKILWLSFNDLPYHLKSCFLYLSVFPEDFDIGSKRIIFLWIAEGFVETTQGNTTKEEVAEGYLNALIARNLIQANEWEVNGKVKFCCVHDLVREIILLKSKDENLFVSSTEENIVLSDKIRRLSIHNEGKIVPNCEGSSHLRSLLIFGGVGLCDAFSISSFSRLHLLRVVSIENVPIESFPEDLTSLLHLRYLRLQNTKIKYLPSSVGKLINLETLLLMDNLIRELPVDILKLKRLRHIGVFRGEPDLYFSYNSFHGAKFPSGVGSLRSLQALATVEAESAGELGKLTQLRDLRLANLRREDGHDLCTSVEKMRHLQILLVKSREEDEELDLHSLSNPPQTLQELYLHGHLKNLPQWIASLQNLVALRLSFSKLVDDPLEALGSLPNLTELWLSKAYDGEEMRVGDGCYRKLKALYLVELRGLKKLRMEKGAMPNLEVLSIRRCEALVEVPFWLHHLTNLKKLFLRDMPTAFLEGLQRDGKQESIDFIRHIPLIRCYETETNKDWRIQ